MKTFRTGEVPCGDCRLCCINEIVILEPEEEGQYIMAPHPTKPKRYMVAHAGKDCIYLEADGCSIHERRPKLCREFDCRWIAAKFKWGKARTLGMGDTWERGRELLKELQ